MYIYIIICKLLECIDKQPINKDLKPPTIADFYKVSTYFIFKYIQFIVKQGVAIVSTLEHLKFFFLSRTNNIDDYNKLCLGSTEVNIKNKAYVFTEGNIDNLLTTSKKFKYDTNIGVNENGEPINIEETVNIGDMNTYGLLDILQQLAGNGKEYKQTKSPINRLFYTIDLFSSAEEESPSSSSIFVMLTNIKLFLEDDSYQSESKDLEPKVKGLICSAAFDTLEFAQSISSLTQNNKVPSLSQSDKSTGKFKITDLYKFIDSNLNYILKGVDIKKGGYKKNFKNINTNTNTNPNTNLKQLDILIHKSKQPKTHRNKKTIKQMKKKGKGNGKTLFIQRSKKYYD